MCSNPLKIRNKSGEAQMVQCRKCEECEKHRKRRFLGRVLAEVQTSKSLWFCTFTYGGGYDNARAYLLHYSDVQNMFKRLRKDGYKFKYVVAGEYGTKAERSHFHVLIFWQGRTPDAKFSTDGYHWPYWTMGFSYIELPRNAQASAAYMMKYMTKDALNQGNIKYSKAPPLGTEYLQQYSAKHAYKGVSLFQRGNVFTIPNNTNKDGKLFYYPVDKDSSMFTKMISHWVDIWAIVRPDQRLPVNEHIETVLEDMLQEPHQNLWTRKYLEETMGATSVDPAKIKRHVVTVCDNMHLSVLGNYVQMVITHPEGMPLWSSDLPELENDELVEKIKQGVKPWPKSISETLTRKLREAPLHAQFHVGNQSLT